MVLQCGKRCAAYAFGFELRGLAWPPSRKPLRKRRRTIFKYRQRPVPVVFLRLAFSDQLSIIGREQKKFRIRFGRIRIGEHKQNTRVVVVVVVNVKNKWRQRLLWIICTKIIPWIDIKMTFLKISRSFQNSICLIVDRCEPIDITCEHIIQNTGVFCLRRWTIQRMLSVYVYRYCLKM